MMWQESQSVHDYNEGSWKEGWLVVVCLLGLNPFSHRGVSKVCFIADDMRTNEKSLLMLHVKIY